MTPPVSKASTDAASNAAVRASSTRNFRDLRPAVPFLLLATFCGVASTAFLEADDVAHFEYSRWCFKHPESVLEVWGRPLVTLYYAAPAIFGPKAARLASLLLGAAAAFAAARLCRRFGAATSGFAAAATLAMPYVFVQTYAIMTELLFSVVLAAGCVVWRRGSRFSALLVWTWLPLIRPEGFFLGVFFGLLTLIDRAATPEFGRRFSFRRFAAATCLGFGTVVWWLAGLPVYRSVFWLLDRWPKVWAAESPYGSGVNHPLLFVAFLGLVATPPLVPFLVVGARAAWASRFRLEIAIVAFLVVLHAVLWTFRLFGSAGYPRYLVTAAPLLGALIGRGMDVVVEKIASRRAAAARPKIRGSALAATSTIFCALLLAWPPARPWHGDVDVAALRVAADWFERAYPSDRPRPFVVVDHPAFRPMVDVDPTGASCRFEPLPLAFAPIGAVAIWETKFAARYSKASREDLAREGFVEVPLKEVAGDPPYPWRRPRGGPFADPELDDFDFGVFIKKR